jgi:predicted O-methyltransferase YrrM
MDETRQAFLDELYAHGRAHDEQRDDRLQRLRNVEPETAELLGVLVRAMQAKRVLEIGTSNGYSTIWLGDAAEAGVAEFVELCVADAGEALRSFADGEFCLIFLDAERKYYLDYWPDLIRVLRANGLLVVDNTLSHAKELVEFSELVYSDPAVTSTLVTVGAGVMLIVKAP